MKSIDVDLSQHFSLQIAALKCFGMWFYIPHSVKTIRFWFSIFIRVFLGITVFIIPTGGQLIYVIRLLILGNAEIQEVAGIINLIMTELLASLRLLDLFLRRGILIQLADQLMSKEFQFYLKPQKIILEKAVFISRKLFWVLLFSCGMDILVLQEMWCTERAKSANHYLFEVSATTYCKYVPPYVLYLDHASEVRTSLARFAALTPASAILVLEIHVIVVPGSQKFEVLPLKMDLIWFDVNKESYFGYVFAYQVLYKPMMLTIFIALQTLPWAAMTSAISQLDVLIYNFENMKELVKTTMAERQCDSNTAFKEIFKGCVLHHCSIIRFVNTIQDAFGGQLTSTLCLSGAIVCTTAVQIFSIQSPLKNITDVIWILAYLSIFIANLFIDCYFGNSVTVRSLRLPTVIFSCPWIELPTSLKKNLVLFIAKTQRPIVITAAKFVPVSLETFTKIMNWTYKGFAVMNQMKK